MSSAYGWSYASVMRDRQRRQQPPKKNKYNKKKNSLVNQRMHSQQLAAPEMPLLNKTEVKSGT